MFYVVVEGIEGAGKTTAMRIVKDFLEKITNKKVCTTREPGGTPLAEELRTLFKKETNGEKVDVVSELLIVYASRNQLLFNVVESELSKGHNVLSDRSYYTSKAYQGSECEDGSKEKELLNFLSEKTVRVHPDLVIYLDISVKTSCERVSGRGDSLDRIEKKGSAYFEKIVKEYDKIFNDQNSRNKYSDMSAIRIDAEQSMESVEIEILEKLNTWYEHKMGNKMVS